MSDEKDYTPVEDFIDFWLERRAIMDTPGDRAHTDRRAWERAVKRFGPAIANAAKERIRRDEP